MSDTTTIVLAAISTVGACFSAWMASRSGRHATTSTAAARYIANSLRPPPGDDPLSVRPPMAPDAWKGKI